MGSKECATGSHWLHRYSSVTANLEFGDLLKIMEEHLELVMCSFRMAVNMRTSKKLSVPTKPKTVSVVVVILGNLFLLRLMACISSYLNSVLIYKFLIFT